MTTQLTEGVSIDTDADVTLERLYDAHYVRLVRLAVLLLGDAGRAEEVVQDSFVAVYRRLDRLGDADLPAYLRQTVVNRSRSVLRHLTVVAKHPPDAPVDEPGADHDVLRGARRRAVIDAMARLPRRQREVLALRYYLDLSEREIAETLGISPGREEPRVAGCRCPAPLPVPTAGGDLMTRRLRPAPAAGRRRLRRAPGGWSRSRSARVAAVRRPRAGCRSPLAAAVATILVIGGGAWLAQQQSATTPLPPAPGTPQAPAPQAAEPSRTVDATVYYVGEHRRGPRLFPEARTVDGRHRQRPAGRGGRGSSPAGRSDPDYQSWPSTELGAPRRRPRTAARSRSTSPSPATGRRRLRPARRPPKRAVQSLVWTATAAAGTEHATGPVHRRWPARDRPVRLGVDTAAPVQRAGEDAVIAPVLIDSPAQGAKVPTQFAVTGRAATFEANVVWELKRGDATVRNGFTTAQECCTLSPYSFT